MSEQDQQADSETKQDFGVGGTPGGLGHFITGILMMCIGFYLLLTNITVTNTFMSGFGMGIGMYNFGNFSVTSGMILLPICFGIGRLFFDGRSVVGWILFAGGLAALIAGVILNTHFFIRPMSLFDLLCIFVLTFGGTGLFLRSLCDHSKK